MNKGEVKSHPTWVRGLKLFKEIGVYAIDPESHPTWVRGLKYLHISGLDGIAVSHPTWVRGLKSSC